jgi:hypothetical protein
LGNPAEDAGISFAPLCAGQAPELFPNFVLDAAKLFANFEG